MFENLVALVVEDDAHALMVISKTLKELGFNFKRNTTGARVLEQVRAMHPRPDVILLDIELPDGDAYTIAHQLRTDPVLASIPVIGMGDAESSSIQKMQSSGFDGMICKPVPRRQLGTLLRRALSGDQVWPAPA